MSENIANVCVYGLWIKFSKKGKRPECYTTAKRKGRPDDFRFSFSLTFQPEGFLKFCIRSAVTKYVYGVRVFGLLTWGVSRNIA